MLIVTNENTMPIVNIKMMAGRSVETKRILAEKVTQAVAESLQIDKQNVWLSIEDMQPENFAQSGVLIADKKKS
ncbi:MAG: 4-oxalocrotonate tautomerase family protein [Neisseriaceae bacterium]|nr:4-oxalocrotonate tautomerase family protein [Neisseriaceae bacterium]MBR3482203.1 4-oxalocrotonate tautomerase family protein [Neisseriaceae bacterium]